MVKGVNKRVIEVNQTGNKFFEKIVFYITPEYGDLTASQLKKATDGFFLELRKSMGALSTPSLREIRRKKRRNIIILAVLGALCLGSGVALAIIL